MIQQANKANKKLRIALFGNSGNGKSHTSIAMATQLGRTLVLDSEDGAANVFADIANFAVLPITDISPEGYVNAINEAAREQKNFDCIVIDGLSQAWQFALQEVSKERNTQLGWGRLTPRWDAIFHSIKRLQTHVIVTFRSKTRKNENDQWEDTWDSRENSDYDFDLILQMLGTKIEQNATVCKAKVTKCRFNIPDNRLKVGTIINAGNNIIRYLQKWQNETAQQQTAQQGE